MDDMASTGVDVSGDVSWCCSGAWKLWVHPLSTLDGNPPSVYATPAFLLRQDEGSIVETPELSAVLPPEMGVLRSRPLFIFSLDVAKPQVVGPTPGVDRRVGEIKGGRFEGERLRGRILGGGSDWQAVRADGSWALDCRLVLETDDGALIAMTYRGLRHGPKDVIDAIARGEQVSPGSYYFRTAAFFETAAAKYAWLNGVVAAGVGHRLPTGPIYHVFEIL